MKTVPVFRFIGVLMYKASVAIFCNSNLMYNKDFLDLELVVQLFINITSLICFTQWLNSHLIFVICCTRNNVINVKSAYVGKTSFTTLLCIKCFVLICIFCDAYFITDGILLYQGKLLCRIILWNVRNNHPLCYGF